MALFDQVPREQGSEWRDLAVAMLTVWGCNLLQLLVSILLISLFVGIYALYFFSAVQLIYVIPMVVSAYQDKNHGRVKGIVIAACMTVMLNVACSSQTGAPWRLSF